MQQEFKYLWVPELEITHVYAAFIKSQHANLRLYLDHLEVLGFKVDCSKLHELRNAHHEDLIYLCERYCKELFNEINVIFALCECDLRFCPHCNIHKSRQIFMHNFADISNNCKSSVYIYLYLINNEISRSYLSLQKEYLQEWIKHKIVVSDTDKYKHLDCKEYIIVRLKDTSVDLPKDCDLGDVLIITKNQDIVTKLRSLLVRSKKRMLS